MATDCIAPARLSAVLHTDPRSTYARYSAMTPAETGLILAHFLGLDARDRATRFGAAVRDEWIHRYCASLDWAQYCATGRVQGGTVSALVELVGSPTLPDRRLELALSIHDIPEREQVRAELLHLAQTTARLRGAREIVIT